jgi:RNA polymerase sigma-70 factor, ECF subfamily
MKHGEEPATWVEAFYRRQAAPLILYGRALGLSHAEAEDVLQETVIALMRMSEPPAEPDFYGLRAFRNRALNYKRGLIRRLAREFESRRWFEPTTGEPAGERAAMRALAALPRDQREVIVLKIWHGHTFEEIGRLLELSPHTAAGRYRYGMKKIRACLEDFNHERDEPARESFALLETAPPVSRP